MCPSPFRWRVLSISPRLVRDVHHGKEAKRTGRKESDRVQDEEEKAERYDGGIHRNLT